MGFRLGTGVVLIGYLVRLQNLIIHAVFGLALYFSYQVSNALA